MAKNVKVYSFCGQKSIENMLNEYFKDIPDKFS